MLVIFCRQVTRVTRSCSHGREDLRLSTKIAARHPQECLATREEIKRLPAGHAETASGKKSKERVRNKRLELHGPSFPEEGFLADWPEFRRAPQTFQLQSSCADLHRREQNRRLKRC